VSNLLAQIKDSATLMCTSIDDPTVYPSCFAGKGDMTYLQWMIHGLGWTLLVAFVALAIALVVGLVIGVMRTLPNRAAVIFGEAWTEVFRNVPVLVQLFIWAFVLPEIFPTLKSVSYPTLACVGLGLFTSARVAQQVKAGISTIPKGQRYAGLAMGLTLAQTYRYVLLPVGLRVVLPTLTSESMNIVKNSSVAYAISVQEMIWTSIQAGEQTSAHGTMYFVATVFYVITALAVNRLAALVERRTRLSTAKGGK
jgi:glutamate/aspartate transport system permease protein